MSNQYDFLFKVLIIGDTSVGKSSVLLRFTDDQFSENFMTTIGVDFKIKTFDTDGSTIKLQVWDTAGQQKFRTITANYYKGAHGIIFVYDITNRQSFNNIQFWLNQANKFNQNAVKFLIGNKSDLECVRQIKTQEGKKLADSFGFKFLETSAKDSVNVQKSFFALSNEMKEKVKSKPAPIAKQKFTLQRQLQKKSYCC